MVFSLLSFLTFISCSNTWIAINVESDRVNSSIRGIAYDPKNPEIIYVSTSGFGCFKSQDSGASWRPINNGITGNLQMGDIATNPTWPEQVVVGSHNGIYISINSGNSWTPNTIAEYRYVPAIGFDPDGTFIFCGVDNEGMYSTGARYITWPRDTWTQNVINNVPHYDIRRMATTRAERQTLYVSSSKGILKTTNLGLTFQESFLPEIDNERPCITFGLIVDQTDAKTAFVGVWNHGVYATTNSGDSWTPANVGLPTETKDFTAMAFAQHHSTFFVGLNGLGGIYRTDDYGSTWSEFGLEGCAVHLNAMAVINNHLFVGTDKGFFKIKL